MGNPLQNFSDKQGPVVNSAFLNGVDTLANSVFNSATTNTAARNALCTDAPLEIANGGTGSRTAAAARTALTLDAPLEVLNGGTGARSLAAFQTVTQQTLAEAAANVTPVNLNVPPGHVDRYQTNSSPGSTDMTAGFQAAINQARYGGRDVVWGDTGIYLLATGALDCTFPPTGTTIPPGAQQYGINFRQISSPGLNFPPSTTGGILVSHSDYTVFDLTGCNHFTFYDASIVTASSATGPKTCFLTARNSSQESNVPRFYNTTVAGAFSVAILYNYGSEDGIYHGNFWNNYSPANGACCVVITTSNFFKSDVYGPGSSNFMQSRFAPMASGPQSTIGHTFFGGDFGLLNTSAKGDVFYLEGGVQSFRLYAPWLDNSTISGGSIIGRSYVYNDTTNGPASLVVLDSVKTEISVTAPAYGVFIGTSPAAPIFWSMRDCYLITSTFAFASANNVTAVGFSFRGNAELASKGINWPGLMEDSFIDWETIINISTSTRNVITTALANLNISTNNASIIRDQATGSIYAKGSLGMAGSQGASQSTGWGTPTGGSVVNNFPGSSATLAQCGQALSIIIAQLKSLGLLGT